MQTVEKYNISSMSPALKFGLIAFGMVSAHLIPGALRVVKARKKMRTDIKRNQKKYGTLKKKEKEFYAIILFYFHLGDSKK